MTYQQFIDSADISMKATPADHNPLMEGDMDHWRCILRAGRSAMTITFSMGTGHHGVPPTLAEVLECLASDSYTLPLPEMAGSEEEAFVEWCGEYGCETDSRKALAIYRACLSQSRRLRRFLGESAFNTLMRDVSDNQED